MVKAAMRSVGNSVGTAIDGGFAAVQADMINSRMMIKVRKEVRLLVKNIGKTSELSLRMSVVYYRRDYKLKDYSMIDSLLRF